MVQRCLNKKCSQFKNYGARGIIICERWSSFDNFASDMGKKPSREHSLDRIDVNGNYEPDNCRWSTTHEQANNKRNSVHLRVGSDVLSVSEIGTRFNVSAGTIYSHVERHGKVKAEVWLTNYLSGVRLPPGLPKGIGGKKITISGRTKSVYEWSKISGIAVGTLYNRIRVGWPTENLLNEVR